MANCYPDCEHAYCNIWGHYKFNQYYCNHPFMLIIFGVNKYHIKGEKKGHYKTIANDLSRPGWCPKDIFD